MDTWEHWWIEYKDGQRAPSVHPVRPSEHRSLRVLLDPPPVVPWKCIEHIGRVYSTDISTQLSLLDRTYPGHASRQVASFSLPEAT